MKRLSDDEVRSGLGRTEGWSLEQGEIVRIFQFADFLGAMRFVNAAADLAEKAAHHPDIDIRYNRVRMALTTHDAGGITERDFSLAAQLTSAAAILPA